MAETTQINQRVKLRTVTMIDELSEATHRGKGEVIDWAVEKVYKDHKRPHKRIQVTPETIATTSTLPGPVGASAPKLLETCQHPEDQRVTTRENLEQYFAAGDIIDKFTTVIRCGICGREVGNENSAI